MCATLITYLTTLDSLDAFGTLQNIFGPVSLVKVVLDTEPKLLSKQRQ